MARKLTQEEILGGVARELDEPSGRINRLNRAGEGSLRIGSGIASTAFNILDQPKSSISTGVKYALDDDEKTDFMQGFLRGLTGKEHTSYSEILEQQGVTNPLVKGILGFAGDVAFDPLTYTRGFNARGMTKGTAEIKGLQQAYEEVAEGRIRAGVVQERASQLADDLIEKNPYKIGVKFGFPTKEREIWSMNEPRVVQQLRDRIRGVEGEERGAVKAFSRAAEQPYGFDKRAREIEASLAGRMQDRHYSIKAIGNAVSRDEDELAARMYERPDLYEKHKNDPLVAQRVLGRTSSALEKAGITTLGEYVDWSRDFNKQLRRAQMEIGLHQHLIPDNVIHGFDAEGNPTKTTTKPAWDELPAAKQDAILDAAEEKLTKLRVENKKALEIVPGASRKASRGGPTYNVPSNLTWDELEITGAKPLVSLGQANADRLAASFREQTQAAMNRTLMDELGVNATTEEGQAIMKQISENKDNPIKWVKVQREAAENGLINDVANLPQYKDVYVPDALARVMNASEDVLTNPDLGSAFINLVDRVMGHWKAFNTVLSPGYFVRTSIGDIMQNASNGVWDPRRYYQSMRMLHDVKANQIADLASSVRDDVPIGDVVGPGLQSSTFAMPIGGTNKLSHEVYDVGLNHGIMSGDIVTELQKGITSIDPGAEASLGARLRMANLAHGAKGRLTNAEAFMSDFNVKRETTLRFTNFIHTWDREIKDALQGVARARHMSPTDYAGVRASMGRKALKDLEDKAAQRAAETVRKVNIDYGGLTQFEKKYMRRVFPFYTFFRKNFPLQLSMLVTNPGYMAAIPKASIALQNIIGADDATGDYMVPRWIRESMPIRLASGGQEGGFVQKLARFASGATDDTSVFMPMFPSLTPAGDIQQVLGPIQRAYETGSPMAGVDEAARVVANMGNPMVKGVYERATGKSAFTQEDLGDWKEWLVGQSFGGPGRAVWTGAGFGDKPVVPALSSYLLGPRAQAVGQERQQSEFRRRADPIEQTVRKLRAALAAEQGIEPTSKRYRKVTSPEIEELSKWLREAGRTVGSYGYEE